MLQLRFNHVFVGLMGIAALSAFAVPPSLSNRGRAAVQNVFAPVARPTRVIAGWLHDRFAHPAPVDDAAPGDAPRTLAQLRDENHQLKLLTVNLTVELQKLREVNAERESVGADIRDFCTPFQVMGADTGVRASLSIQGTSLDEMTSGMPVLFGGELVGRIDRVGVGGAQVQLVTDAAFRVTGAFARFATNSSGQVECVSVAAPPVLVEGTGKGAMLITRLSLRDVKESGLKEGDWVVLADDDAPWQGMRGRRLGRIASIAPRRNAPLHAEIRVQPRFNLMQLREVMVLTGKHKSDTGGTAGRLNVDSTN
jgi:cell shape-determining protein MreC